MSQPTPYTRQADFTGHSTAKPSEPVSGVALDAEFNAVKVTTDQTRANLGLIQRDDGRLRNASVHPDAFDGASLLLMGSKSWTPRGEWAASTKYAVGDMVENGDGTYVAAVAHVSSDFTSDRVTGNWLVVRVTQDPSRPALAPVRAATTGNITLSGLQTIDGVLVSSGDRVLVRAQTDDTENGVFVASANGWSRASDFDEDEEILTGVTVRVTAGSIYAGQTFALATEAPVSIGTTPIEWIDAIPREQGYFDTVAALRTNTAAYLRVDLSGNGAANDGGGGIFVADPTDTTSADDGGLVIVDAAGMRWKRQTNADLTTAMFGIFPGGVSASAIVAMNTAAAGRPIAWQAGTYLIDGKMSFGTTPINWRSAEAVTLVFDADTHQGESWIRSDGSVTARGFTFDGNNAVAKVWDARTAGTYLHSIEVQGSTFCNGLQPGVLAPTTGASSGLIVDGDFALVDISHATFRDIDATSSGTGGDRGVSRGFQVAGLNNTSPRECIGDYAEFINITNSGQPWGGFDTDADAIVWRNTNPAHSFSAFGPKFRNCQKRYVKANVAINCFVTEPQVYGEAGKPTRTGFDFQIGSGAVTGGRCFFEDETAFPTAGVFGYMSDGAATNRNLMIRGVQVDCAGTIPNDGSGGTERCILSVAGATPTGAIQMSDNQFNVDIPYLVNARMDALANSGDANDNPLRRMVIKGNRVEKISQSAFVFSRSGTGFVYAFINSTENEFIDGPSQTSVTMNSTNIEVRFLAGNGAGSVTHSAVPTIGRQGFVMEPSQNNQVLIRAEAGPTSGSLAVSKARALVTPVGTTAVPLIPSGAGFPLSGKIIVRGERIAGGNRLFVDEILYVYSGDLERLGTGTAERNAPAARTYSMVSGAPSLAVAADTYHVNITVEGF